jgi:hypothetical protein
LFTSLQIKYLIFIAAVLVITIGFAILIFRQLKVVGDKALIAKQRQEVALAAQKLQEEALAAKLQEEAQNRADADQNEDPGQ